MNKPREWTITGSRLNEIKMFGDTVLHFNELVKVREVSEAEDAAVEAMREALEYYSQFTGNVHATNALEAYERARRGKGEG